MRKAAISMNIFLLVFVSLGFLHPSDLSKRDTAMIFLAMSPYLAAIACLLLNSKGVVFFAAALFNALAIAIGLASISIYFFSSQKLPYTVALGGVLLYLIPGAYNEFCVWANKSLQPTALPRLG